MIGRFRGAQNGHWDREMVVVYRLGGRTTNVKSMGKIGTLKNRSFQRGGRLGGVVVLRDSTVYFLCLFCMYL